MGNEFPDLGGHYDVIHHSTYIEKLLTENRVPLRTTPLCRLPVRRRYCLSHDAAI